MSEAIKILTRTSEDAPNYSREVALIVDDEATNRLVLSALLQQLDFKVIEAADGRQAIECFAEEQPDIIFMDIMMPGIDGFEAIRIIKDKCVDIFIPIIVLTALTDEDTLTRCIDEGGDDFMTKPFDAVVLKSKIQSMMRIRELHQRVSVLYTQMKYEEKIAETVFSQAVTAPNVEPSNIKILTCPASTFSGDMVLTAYGPGGDFHILLGDFTGHGLAAAIGALPTAEVFRAMVSKGFSADNVLTAINTKLYTMLPVDIFMAACYVQVSYDLNKVEIYNCGLPEVLIWDNTVQGKINGRLPSKFFPLGIQSDFPYHQIVQRVELTPGNRIYLYSDGVIESRNIKDEEFGQPRLEAILGIADSNDSCYDDIIKHIDDFCGDAQQHDDITLIEMLINERLINRPINGIAELEVKQTDEITKLPTPIQNDHDKFRFEVSFTGKRLQQCEALPLLMSNLHEMHLPSHVLTNIYTVLTELITNALDHGVLQLSSNHKSTAEGFEKYFTEREHRLNNLLDGFVYVQIDGEIGEQKGRLSIYVEDSGNGFDLELLNLIKSDTYKLHGRGIPLVRTLCCDLQYNEPGNKVTAVYEYGIEP